MPKFRRVQNDKIVLDRVAFDEKPDECVQFVNQSPSLLPDALPEGTKVLGLPKHQRLCRVVDFCF